jgi:uncharacterized phage protein (TIGR01671 family)
MRWLKFRVWYKRYPQPIEGEMRFFGQSDDDFANSSRKYQSDDWMQFIGLQDSMGRDVYEGDVVLVTPHAGMDKSSYYGVVEWHSPCFQIKAQKDKFPFSNGYMPVVSSLGMFCGIEVVGNRFENPDLLEEVEK